MNRNKIKNNAIIFNQLQWDDLRYRLGISLFFLIICSCLSFYYVENIFHFLSYPLYSTFTHAYGTLEARRFIFTELTEVFYTYIKISCFTGLYIALPFIIYNIYAFLGPGLYHNEKKKLVMYCLFGTLCYLLGSIFAYYIIMPWAWHFFIGFENNVMHSLSGSMPIILETKIDHYISLSIQFILAFAISFQIPLLLLIFLDLQVITLTALGTYRKYIVLMIFIFSAIVTPPDIYTQICLAIPMILLYESSILLYKFIYIIKRR